MVCILSFFSIVNNRIKISKFLFSPLERIGRIAFSFNYFFFALELIVFPYLSRVIIINLNPKFLIFTYLMSIIILVILAAIIEKVWRKVDYKFGLEWAMHRGSAYLTKFTINKLAKRADRLRYWKSWRIELFQGR